jgi:hypothetical protein
MYDTNRIMRTIFDNHIFYSNFTDEERKTIISNGIEKLKIIKDADIESTVMIIFSSKMIPKFCNGSSDSVDIVELLISRKNKVIEYFTKNILNLSPITVDSFKY